jgi:bifunctional non-homologous end joining protein LigD
MKHIGSLSDYQAKRDFARTPEPRGRLGASRRERSFFIQKHAASHLHYDFRLELDGVLKSWAVPKGPSLDPSVSRLAVHVEDHPLDYGSFEGTIPEGEYGAGTVLLWDRGLWIPEGDPVDAYRNGKLIFALEGRKLQGRWSLVRFKGAEDGTKENWLLRKLRDAAARPSREDDILVSRPESVRSGAAPRELPGAQRAPMPRSIEPELATLVYDAPEGDGWIHEIKFDGYRFMAFLERGRARLVSRNGLDWTNRLPGLAAEIAALPAGRLVLDGELVTLTSEGVSNFAALKDALGKRDEENLIYYAFDLLYLDGVDLRKTPLLRRKEALRGLLETARSPRLRYTDHVVGSGEIFHRRSCEFALEGVVSKKKDSPYRSGRGMDWVKVKCQKRQEFVIAGFTDPQSSRQGFGALLLGVQGKSGLAYAGRVGTGFNASLLLDLRRRLDDLEQPGSPFAAPLPRSERRGVHWVTPSLVAEVSFSNWTRDGRLRHPSFLGLREDKAAADVVRDHPAPPPAAAPAVRLTHPERVLYPEEGITKADLARFYQEIAAWILPQVRGRLLSLVRCPEGQSGPCFYQKHRMDALPAAIRVLTIEEADGPATGLFIEDEAGLLALVQLGVLEIHPWGSRVTDLEHPDLCTFDLDPGPGVAWTAVLRAARDLRDLLGALGLESFVKTTGGKGLHVVVPFRGVPGWPELKAFSKTIAEELARRSPDRYTAKLAKSSRGGRIFIDYLRNGRGATAVAAYSTRAKPNASVAVPLAWDELTPSLRPDQYTVKNLRRRLEKLTRDPWKRFADVKQTLPRGSSRT